MTPISEIIPGQAIAIVTYAKDQPEYIALPAHRSEDGIVTTRWKMTWKERLQVIWHGSIWLSVMTFNKPLQPVKLDTECPLAAAKRPSIDSEKEKVCSGSTTTKIIWRD